jgi:hypothetical protein
MAKYERPKVLHGTTTKLRSGCGSIYCTCNKSETGNVEEVIIRASKAGVCLNCQLSCVGRLISVGLHHGTPLSILARQLVGTRCQQDSGVPSDPGFIPSCLSAVGELLLTISKEEQEPPA